MGDLIQTNNLGYSVYGTAQVDYTVDGVKGCSYDQVVAQVGLQRAVAVEQAVPAYTAAVKARQKKVEDLGTALADIAATLANFGEDDRKPDKKKDVVGGTRAYDLLSAYGLAKDYFSDNGTKISFGNVQKLQVDVQYALDVTNNDLQQDMASLQSLVSKRDGAYQMASKLMKKVCQTRTTGIRYIN